MSGHQQEPDSETSSGDSIRYASSGRIKTGSAKPQTTKVDPSDQQEEYTSLL